MERLSGRLREVVAYKNLTTGGLFRKEVQTHLLYGRYLLHAMSKLRHVWFHVVTKVSRTFLVHSRIVHTATIDIVRRSGLYYKATLRVFGRFSDRSSVAQKSLHD